MEEKYNESEALLTVKDLKMHFPFAEGGLFSRKKGAIRAVDGISFSVKKGETVLSGSPVAENQPQLVLLPSSILRHRVPSCLRGWSLPVVHTTR